MNKKVFFVLAALAAAGAAVATIARRKSLKSK